MISEDDFNARADRARKGSPFLTTAQAAHYVGLARQTLEKMRRKSRGPSFRKHGRHVRYHIADLDAWSSASGRPVRAPVESSAGCEPDAPHG